MNSRYVNTAVQNNLYAGALRWILNPNRRISHLYRECLRWMAMDSLLRRQLIGGSALNCHWQSMGNRWQFLAIAFSSPGLAAR